MQNITYRCLFKIQIRRRRVQFLTIVLLISYVFITTGNGDRRRRARSLVYNQRGDRGRGRKRQRPGNVEKGVPVQDPRDTARAGAAGPREQHNLGHCGDGRNR